MKIKTEKIIITLLLAVMAFLIAIMFLCSCEPIEPIEPIEEISCQQDNDTINF